MSKNLIQLALGSNNKLVTVKITGPQGAGKTTIAEHLVRTLTELGVTCEHIVCERGRKAERRWSPAESGDVKVRILDSDE